MRNVITLIITLLLFALPATSFAVGIEMALGGWQADPSGYVAYTLGPVSIDDRIDLETDAGYDDETTINARVKIDLPLFIPNIYVMATPMEFDGTGSKILPFEYGGQTFDATTNFYSKVVLDHYDVALFWGIPMLKTATLNKLDIEWGLNIRFIDFEGTVTGEVGTVPTTETKQETLVIPMVYVGVEFGLLKSVAAQVEARGLAIGDSSYYDYIARVKYKPFTGPLFIAAGYRFEDIDIDEEEIRAEMEFGGPFVEVGAKF